MKIFYILTAMTDCVKSYPRPVEKDVAKESIFDKLIVCYRRIKGKLSGKIN